MNYIHWLSQIQYSERSLVGNKLFILSQLLQHQCSILPGFVLSDRLWKRFTANLEGELPVVDRTLSSNLEDYRVLQSLANRSRQLINQTSFPEDWQREILQATRQLNSQRLTLELFASSDGLDLPTDSLWRSHTCNATPQAIANAIKLAWSELFTARSLLYLHELGIDIERIKLSILVRPLKTACASGIIEVSRDLMRIAAVWGLERSILEGDVEPDEYYCYRQTEEIVGQHLGHKNYAYRLAEHNTSSGCIEAYVPLENLAATSILDSEAIANLLQLTEEILAQQPQTKYLTWTAWGESHTNPQVYFTRLEDRLTTNLSVANEAEADSSLPPLLTGVGVSPGRVQAPPIAIADLDVYTHAIPPGSILVTRAIEPQHLSLLKQVAGIITETGGHTSHGAILARELNIPAIVNVENATKLIQEKTEVLLDGTAGKVYPPATHQRLIRTATKIFHPTYPIATKLMVNLSQPESIASAIDLPTDGVGLIRSELMLAEVLADRTLAQWQESFQKRFIDTLTSSLRQFTTAFAPRPVFYRSLDRYAQASNLVGDRGTYSYLLDSNLFDLELEALYKLTAEEHTNLNLILPFVRSVEEFKFCYRRIENIGLTAQSSFQVWIMAEVPSTILLLPEYIRAGVGGIAIGTNDLTQLLLGVDRQQTQFSDRGLNANHPAMREAIAQLITIARNYDIKCSICGQAPVEHPDLINFLVRSGIDAISVEPEAVGRTYQEIARAEKRMLLKEVRK